jgi:hypothetical protein
MYKIFKLFGMSIDPVAVKVWNKIRWNRLFGVIE